MRHRALLPFLLLLALIPTRLPAMPTTDDALLTTAERSDFVRTARYAEALQLCESYAARWPEAVRCFG